MKWFALLGLLLFVGLGVAPSMNAEFEEDKIFNNRNGQCLIVGIGDISWLHADNVSWRFGGKYRGFWRTDLIIGNQKGMIALGYCLFLKDLNSGELYHKETLPRYIYLMNFTGYLRGNYYSTTPHGPVGFYFSILGTAEKYFQWNP
jgi:hypothetical protein